MPGSNVHVPNEQRRNSLRVAIIRQNLEILGVPPEALRAYRDALGTVQKMLASNPEPGEIAVALGGDLAKRFFK